MRPTSAAMCKGVRSSDYSDCDNNVRIVFSKRGANAAHVDLLSSFGVKFSAKRTFNLTF